MTIIVNILRGHLVDADQEIPVEQLAVQDGKLFVAGQRYEVLFMGDHRNEFIGLGTDENGLPCIRSRCRWVDGLRDRDEEFLWHWGDIILAPVTSTKEVQMLVPPSFADLLPKEHAVFFVRKAVLQFDLSRIYASYEVVKGQPPYDPTMMVAMLFYAYSRGVRSSRAIERMLWEDIPMRYLSGSQQPNFWTIAQFRKRHLQELAKLFTQTVVLADKAGLVDLTTVAVDGSKLRASASKHKAMSYGRLEAEEKRLEEAIAEQLKAAVSQDEAEADAAQDKGDDGGSGGLKADKKRLENVQAAKAELERRAAEREEQRQQAVHERGGTPRPAKIGNRPREKDQCNFTDPDSRIMKSGDGSFVQGYNAQAGVDAKTRIILAALLTNTAPDVGHLLPVLDQVRRNIGRSPTNVVAAGYSSERNLSELERRNIAAYIPPVRISHMHWRTAKAPRGRIPKHLNARDRMMRKLHTKSGKAIYKQRETSIEPVFGQIKWHRNLKQLLLRGLSNAQASWQFECAVFNLLKMRSPGDACTSLPPNYPHTLLGVVDPRCLWFRGPPPP